MVFCHNEFMQDLYAKRRSSANCLFGASGYNLTLLFYIYCNFIELPFQLWLFSNFSTNQLYIKIFLRLCITSWYLEHFGVVFVVISVITNILTPWRHNFAHPSIMLLDQCMRYWCLKPLQKQPFAGSGYLVFAYFF